MSARRWPALVVPPEPDDVDEVTVHLAGARVRRFQRDLTLGGNPRLWNEVGGMGATRVWSGLLLCGEVREVLQEDLS